MFVYLFGRDTTRLCSCEGLPVLFALSHLANLPLFGGSLVPWLPERRVAFDHHARQVDSRDDPWVMGGGGGVLRRNSMMA